MERVEVDGLQIAYERAGSGPPRLLVTAAVRDFLHGLPEGA
jgi:hypothetical protein